MEAEQYQEILYEKEKQFAEWIFANEELASRLRSNWSKLPRFAQIPSVDVIFAETLGVFDETKIDLGSVDSSDFPLIVARELFGFAQSKFGSEFFVGRRGENRLGVFCKPKNTSTLVVLWLKLSFEQNTWMVLIANTLRPSEWALTRSWLGFAMVNSKLQMSRQSK